MDPVTQEINRRVAQRLGFALLEIDSLAARNAALQQECEALRAEVAALKKDASDEGI